MRDPIIPPSKLHPAAAAEQFVAAELQRLKKPSDRSKCRVAIELYLSEQGAQWPTASRIDDFKTFLLSRHTTMPYMRAQVRVISRWREWLVAAGVWDGVEASGCPNEVSAQGKAGPADGTGVSLNASSLAAVADAVREAVFGGSVNQDYWGTVLGQVAGALGVGALARIFRLDRPHAERLIARRKVPRHLRDVVERLHALVILRRDGVTGDELMDQMEAIGAQSEEW